MRKKNGEALINYIMLELLVDVVTLYLIQHIQEIHLANIKIKDGLNFLSFWDEYSDSPVVISYRR